MIVRPFTAARLIVTAMALRAFASAAPDESGAKGTAATSATTAAQPAAPKPRPRLSPEITSQIASSVPVWKAPPPGKTDQAPPPAPDGDVVQMPRVIVNANRLPRIDPLDWLTPKAQDGVLKKQYLSDLDRSFLNRFTLPLFGISQEARARMMYGEDKRLQELKWLNDQIDQAKQLDPKAAKELIQIRDTTFTRDQP